MKLTGRFLCIAVGLGLLAVAVSVACGGGDKDKKAAVVESTSTPAPTATAAPVGTPTPGPVALLLATATAQALVTPPPPAPPANPPAANPPAANPPVAAVIPTVVAALPGIPSGPPAPTTFNVTIADFAFSPIGFTARVGRAITINARNNGPSTHTFTITGADSGRIAPGTSATLQFTPANVGVVMFRCTIHASMQGAIAVTP